LIGIESDAIQVIHDLKSIRFGHALKQEYGSGVSFQFSEAFHRRDAEAQRIGTTKGTKNTKRYLAGSRESGKIR